MLASFMFLVLPLVLVEVPLPVVLNADTVQSERDTVATKEAMNEM